MASAKESLEAIGPTKKTLRDRINYIKETITVEPVIACYVVPSEFVKLATQNLNLDKACRVNKKLQEAVCTKLIAKRGDQYVKEELEIQQLVAAFESWKTILSTAIPCLLILFIGAWSDRTKKRKICILIPIVGDLLMCLSNMLSVYYFYELPLEVTMFFEAFFPAITGGPMAIYMGAFAYLSDVTSEESRTFRVGALNICFWAAAPLGSALGGILLTHIGYYGVFSLCFLLYTFSITYGYFFIKDPIQDVDTEDMEINLEKRCFLKSFFNLTHVKDTLSVAFKKQPNFRRTKILFILTAIVFLYGAISGEMKICYLFTRYQLNWDAFKFGFYSSFYTCSHIFGTLLAIGLFSRQLKWDDALLGIIAVCSKFMGALITGLAINSTYMYIGATVDMFISTAFTVLRSFASKLCSKDEVGKMMTIFNLSEVLTSLVFGPIYSWIYIYTVEYHASIVYYISTVLMVPALIIFLWFYKQNKRISKQEVCKEMRNSEDKTEMVDSKTKKVYISVTTDEIRD